MSTSSSSCTFCAQTIESSLLENFHMTKSQLTNQQIYCLKQMLSYLTGEEQTHTSEPSSKNFDNEILKLWTSSSQLVEPSGDFTLTQLCDECNSKVQKFIKLQLKLEHVWREVTNVVKNMQGLIVSSTLNSTGFTNSNSHDTTNFKSAVLCAVNTINLKASWNTMETFTNQLTPLQPEPPKPADVIIHESDEDDVVSLSHSADVVKDDDNDIPDSIDMDSNFLPDGDNANDNSNFSTAEYLPDHQKDTGSFTITKSQSNVNQIILIRSSQPTASIIRRRYCCGQCEDEQGNHKVFETESGLRQHIAEKHTGAIFKCSQCEKVFNKSYTLQEHQKIHTGDPYKCETCGKIFSSKCHWKKHVKYAHLEERNFKCDLCEKCFRSPYKLRSHKLTHKQEKNYECKLCSRKLKTRKTFKNHMLTHTAERNVSCDMCWMKFTSVSAVRSHKKRVHFKKQTT